MEKKLLKELHSVVICGYNLPMETNIITAKVGNGDKVHYAIKHGVTFCAMWRNVKEVKAEVTCQKCIDGLLARDYKNQLSN